MDLKYICFGFFFRKTKKYSKFNLIFQKKSKKHTKHRRLTIQRWPIDSIASEQWNGEKMSSPRDWPQVTSIET